MQDLYDRQLLADERPKLIEIIRADKDPQWRRLLGGTGNIATLQDQIPIADANNVSGPYLAWPLADFGEQDFAAAVQPTNIRQAASELCGRKHDSSRPLSQRCRLW